MIALAATRSQTFTLSPARDVFDWMVNPAIAIGAAFLGALVGGRMTRNAALAAQDREAAAASAARLEDEKRRRHQMTERIERTLQRAITLADGLDTESSRDLPKCGVEMRILWESFERQSGDLYLVGTPELRTRIESFMAELHTSWAATETVVNDLNQSRMIAMIGSSMSGRSPGNIDAAYDPSGILESFRDTILKIKETAQVLLAELGALKK